MNISNCFRKQVTTHSTTCRKTLNFKYVLNVVPLPFPSPSPILFSLTPRSNEITTNLRMHFLLNAATSISSEVLEWNWLLILTIQRNGNERNSGHSAEDVNSPQSDEVRSVGLSPPFWPVPVDYPSWLLRLLFPVESASSAHPSKCCIYDMAK